MHEVKSEREVAQSCPTLSDPMDCSLPGSSVRGIFQARVLEWGATAFSTSYETRYQLQKKKKSVKTTNTWRLNNTFLKNERVTEEIKKEIKFLETNDSENKTTQNLWDAAKRVLRGKFIASRNKKNIKYTT